MFEPADTSLSNIIALDVTCGALVIPVLYSDKQLSQPPRGTTNLLSVVHAKVVRCCECISMVVQSIWPCVVKVRTTACLMPLAAQAPSGVRATKTQL